MGKVIISASGGGTTSDECTAYRSNVVEGHTAVTADSNDEPGWGTLPAKPTSFTSLALVTDNNKKMVYSYIPYGAYLGSNVDGKTGAGGVVWDTYQTFVNHLGITSGMIRSGYSILGVNGDPWVVWTGDTNIDGNKILQGYSGYSNGSKIQGKIPIQGVEIGGDRAYATNITGWDGVICSGVRNGYYLNGVNWIHANIPNFTAGNIKKGVNIAGVTGTYVYSDITGYYYQPPNEMAGVTGGFVTKFVGKSDLADEAEFTKQTSYMEIRCTVKHAGTSHNSWGFFVTGKTINLDNVRTIRVSLSGYANYGQTYGFGITTNQDNPTSNKIAYFDGNLLIEDNTPQERIIDVSTVKGNYYLYIYATSYYGTSTGNKSSKIRVFKIEYDTMA